MRRLARLAMCLGVIVFPAQAFAQQSVNLFIGGFNPRSEDARGTDDVLFANLSNLTFNIKDFNGATFGGEWLIGLGDLFDAGLGIGFYQSSAPSVYTKLVNSDGSEIEQTLKLRTVPFTATIRFLPLGHRAVVQPYVGGGVGVMWWRYSESGQWVDSNNNIFRNTYIGSGTKAGPVILGGVMVPVGRAAIGGEIRYQSAKANLPTDQGFGFGLTNPKIDLGGMNYLFIVSFRF